MLWILLIEIFAYVVPVIDITLVLLFLSVSLNSISRVCFTQSLAPT